MMPAPPVVSRPRVKVAGATVGQLDARGPFRVNRGSGYSNPDIRWRWCCNVCTFACEDRSKDECQLMADAHVCGAGWCAIPMTPERVALLGRPHLPEPTKEDRKRWFELRERNKRRA